MHEAQMTALAEENTVLRRRVDTLESLLRVAGCDLQAVKIVLGPWYHNSQNATPERRISSELSSELQPSTASTSQHGHDEHVARSGDTGPLPSPAGQPDVFAPYFPAEEEIPDFARPPMPLHSPTRIPHNTAMFGQSWDSLSNAGMRHTLHNAVAPLNLTTTLEGSLEALRQSIVTLSSSVDSLSRRNDIALTNETFRINEEIMSLKANMHGLRMQVHTILMDRNAQVTRRVQDSQEGSGWPPPRFSGLAQQLGSGTKL
ncbi:hypothetical protein V5O48_002830 [Marasmius crinis-equi]|uniref:Uncharacterized protein n=1 Tax=Marasmius crinis-equi TaxID=585013 RepID=A0ABR3FUG9_9AGAR